MYSFLIVCTENYNKIKYASIFFINFNQQLFASSFERQEKFGLRKIDGCRALRAGVFKLRILGKRPFFIGE